ncbi:MAG TPA: patatin-like phospholipase family protein, partial [Pyrinomonadaceae bacterium]
YLATYPGLLDALRAGPGSPGPPDPRDPDPPYADALNRLLDDEAVFEWSRFERAELREETRALAGLDRLGAGRSFDDGDGVSPPWSDRARYRRLLLEDAFPGLVARAYDLRLDRVLARVHALPGGQSALCFSGGGIRSGTFALGVIQGLARYGLLDKFDYLSTVSGGGYIGGWLTAWIHRHPEGLEGVVRELNGEARDSRLAPEPAPLRHLRDYSSFLTPRTGLLSADTWTFVTIYLRNLLLNWSAMIPLLLSVLMLPRVFNAVMLANPLKFRGHDAPTFWLPTAFLLLGTLLSGYVIAFTRLNRPSKGGTVRPGSFWDRHRGQRSFLKYCFLPLLASALLLTIYWAWLQRGIEPKLGPLPTPDDILAFPLFGLVVGLTGGAIYMAAVAFSWRHDEKKVGEARRQRWRFAWSAAKEVLVTALAGAVAALVLYVVATKIPAFFELDQEALVTNFEGTRVKLFTQWHAEWYTCLALPAYLLIFFLGTTLFVGLTSRRREVSPKVRRAGGWKESVLYVEDEDREWLARFSAWLFIGILGWGLLSALVIFGPLALFQLGQWAAAAGGLSGLLTVLGGSSAKTPANARQEARQGWKGVVAKHLVFVASVVFIAFFITLLSLVTSLLVWWLPTKLPLFDSLGGRAEFLRPLLEFPAEKYAPLTGGFTYWGEMVYRAVHYPTVEFTLALAVALQVLGQIMARNINLNKFSLHASYRDRLIRAFLGASRLRNERRANPFTGFDPRDNLYMHELRPGLLTESDFKPPEQSDSAAPGGLAGFVKRLSEAGDGGGAAADKGEAADAVGARESADEYLRRRIREIGGAAEKYFGEGTADAR